MITAVAIPLVANIPTSFGLSADISAPGLVKTLAWVPVAGATGVEVTQATLKINPATADESFPDVPVLQADSHRDVSVPAGRSVKTIGLDAVPLPGQRLTLSLPSVRGGFEAPLYASIGVGNGAMAPSSPQGATLANGLFRLPRAVTAAKLRLSMVTGDKVTEFDPAPFALSKVNLQTSTAPRNLRVLGPDNTPLWQAPEFPIDSPEAEVDLRVPLEMAFKKSLADPRANITVAADAPSRAYVSFGAVRGALLRVEEGIRTMALEGAPRALALATPLANEQPASASGDLTVRYDGLRILETVSDAVPATTRYTRGFIVGATPVLRTFPSEALNGIVPARIGILGRAPEDCEIALEFVPVVGNTAGPPLAPPAMITLTASEQIELHWAQVPTGLTLPKAVGLQARANVGRFFWAANEAQPVVRVAIFDPNPAGRALRVGAATLAPITQEKLHLPKFAFTPAYFRGGPVVLDSELFLTVEVSDLTLRYAR